MGPLRYVGACALATVLLLAGCTSGNDASAPTSDGLAGPNDALFDDETGAIVGVVTDDALVPLADVAVSLDSEAAGATDANGTFRIAFVAPGVHTLQFRREGYLPTAQDVSVLAGGSAEVSVRLASAAASDASYFTTWTKAGMDGCSVGYRFEDKPSQGISTSSLNYSYPACNLVSWAFPDLDNSIIDYPFGSLEHMTGFWSETTWTSTQVLGTEMFLTWTYHMADSASVHHNFARGLGESPLRIRVPIDALWDRIANDTLEADCPVDNCTLHNWHAVGYYTVGTEPYGVGLGLQQRFDDYVTLFYNTPVPQRFTVIPDE